jgi:hypothetical protein
MFPVGNPTNPVPPVTPTRAELDEAIEAYKNAHGGFIETLVIAARAYREGLPAPPKTRLIQTWHVEYVGSLGCNLYIDVCTDKAGAEARAGRYHAADQECIRITGPHEHEVPA